jgi:DNA recombination protein RmuC
MVYALALLLLLAVLANLGLLIVLVRRPAAGQESPDSVRTELRLGREEARSGASELRSEVSRQIHLVDEALRRMLTDQGQLQQGHQASVATQMRELSETARVISDSQRSMLDARIRDLQEGNDRKLGDIRGEIGAGLKTSAEAVVAALEQMRVAQERQLAAMIEQLRGLASTNQEALERFRTAFDQRVKEMQESNERKLEEMRHTVNEKLHEALEKRLGESFKLVSERLESVHKGLGEMQSLASGVGDLKRVLTNVKTRGTWAEVQLGAILGQILTPEQFGRNVCVKEGSTERVEFAVRLPGPKDDPSVPVWLPIDSKFPHEDYARLQSAAEAGDAEGVQAATDALLRVLRLAAREIHDKYVNPPATTDFAIMFLATEGLYAEALRQPALLEELQQELRIVLAGPTTLAAILNSLRMGFQTLAVEQRAAEVWRVLGGVKTEFGKFGTWLEKIQRQLQSATNTLAETGTRTRAMERQLRSVERLDNDESATILRLPGVPPRSAETDDEASGEAAAQDSGTEETR